MKIGNSINLLNLYFRKKKNIIKTADHLILKNPLYNYSQSIINESNCSNLKFNTPQKENNKKNQLPDVNEDQINELKKCKLILPKLSINRSSKNANDSKKNRNFKVKLIKIKKINYSSFSAGRNNNNNIKLKLLYKENNFKKKKLEKYKEMKKKNIQSFSFKKYNDKLLKLSSLDISEESFKIFKKYMKSIEMAMNGNNTIKNKFNKFYGEINFTKDEKKEEKVITENKTEKGNINF